MSETLKAFLHVFICKTMRNPSGNKEMGLLCDAGRRKLAATCLSQGEKDVMYMTFEELQFFVLSLAK